MNEFDVLFESPIVLANMFARDIRLGARPVKLLKLALKRKDFVGHLDNLPLTIWRTTFRKAYIHNVWTTVGLHYEVFYGVKYRRLYGKEA